MRSVNWIGSPGLTVVALLVNSAVGASGVVHAAPPPSRVISSICQPSATVFESEVKRKRMRELACPSRPGRAMVLLLPG